MKAFYKSKTIWGILVAVAPQVVPFLPPTAQLAISVAGGAFAAYGRHKAGGGLSVS